MHPTRIVCRASIIASTEVDPEFWMGIARAVSSVVARPRQGSNRSRLSSTKSWARSLTPQPRESSGSSTTAHHTTGSVPSTACMTPGRPRSSSTCPSTHPDPTRSRSSSPSCRAKSSNPKTSRTSPRLRNDSWPSRTVTTAQQSRSIGASAANHSTNSSNASPPTKTSAPNPRRTSKHDH